MKILCKNCNTEIEVTQPNKVKSCGCLNKACLRLDKDSNAVIMAEDMTKVVAVEWVNETKSVPLTNPQLQPKISRKPRKLEFEVR